jgi:hypothetical protein
MGGQQQRESPRHCVSGAHIAASLRAGPYDPGVTFLGLNSVDWTGIAAIATVVLALEGGTLLAQWKSRWDAQAQVARTDQARRENELHRARFDALYAWWHDMPDSPDRVAAMRWFGEWTGASRPFHGGASDGPMTPGLHAAGTDEAYRDYVNFLEAQYGPHGRMGRPRPPL